MRLSFAVFLLAQSAFGALNLEYIVTSTVTNQMYADSGTVGGDKINRNFSNIIGGYIPVVGLEATNVTTTMYQNLSSSNFNVYTTLAFGSNKCWIERNGTNYFYATPMIAATNMTTGDTLYMGPGTFSVTPYTHAGGTSVESSNWAPFLFVNLSNIAVVGSGPATRLSLTTNGHVFGLSNCRYVTFSDFAIDGLPFTFSSTESIAGTKLQYSALITLTDTNQFLRFERLDLKGSQHGISQLWEDKTSTDVTISHCNFYGFGVTNYPGATSVADGTAVSGIGSRWNISHCTFDYCTCDIEIESGDYTAPISDCIFTDNLHIRNRWICYAIWPKPNYSTPNVRNVVIANNVMSNKVIQAGIALHQCIGIDVYGVENLTIKGNTFSGFMNGNTFGIAMVTDSAQINNVVIADNVFHHFGGTAIGVGVGAGTAIFPTNFTITGNVVRDGGLNIGAGCTFELRGYYFDVAHNTLVDVVKQEDYAGIRLRSLNYSYIHDNLIVDTRASSLTKVGVYNDAGSSNNTISCNKVVNVLTNVHNLDGTTAIYLWNDHYDPQRFSTSAASQSVVVDLNYASQWIRVTNDLTISAAANVAAYDYARFTSVTLTNAGGTATLTFPATWRWIGTTNNPPASIGAGRVGVLALKNWGGTWTSNIVAGYAQEQ